MKKLRWGFVQVLGMIACLAHSAVYGVRWEELEGHTPDGKKLLCLHLPLSDCIGYIPAVSDDPRAPKLEEKDDAVYLHPTEQWIEQLHSSELQDIYESMSGMTPEGEEVLEKLENLQTPGHDRRNSANPSTWPYRTIVCLKLFFEGRDPTKPAIGTGVIIGPHHVLTVGHNIFDRRTEATVERIEVLSGLDFPNCHFGQQEVVKAYLFKNWKEGRDESENRYDIALILVERSVGSKTGLCGLAAYRDSIPDQPISLYGYAATWKNKRNDKLVGMDSKSENVTSDEGNVFYTKTDSSGGQSGSPVIQKGEDGAPYAIGVHRAGRSPGSNVGTRVTKAILTSFIHPLLSETWVLDRREGSGTYEDPRCVSGVETYDAVQGCTFQDQIVVVYPHNKVHFSSNSGDGRDWNKHSILDHNSYRSCDTVSAVSFKDKLYLSLNILYYSPPFVHGTGVFYSEDAREWLRCDSGFFRENGIFNATFISFKDYLFVFYNLFSQDHSRSDTVFMSSSQDGLEWEEGGQLQGFSTRRPIALAVHGNNRLFAAFVKSSEEFGDSSKGQGKIYFSWSEDGRTWEEPVNEIPYLVNKGTVKIGFDGDKLLVTYVDLDGRDERANLILIDGKAWGIEERIQSWKTRYSISLLPFRDEMLLFYTRQEDGRVFYAPYRGEGTITNPLQSSIGEFWLPSGHTSPTLEDEDEGNLSGYQSGQESDDGRNPEDLETFHPEELAHSADAHGAASSSQPAQKPSFLQRIRSLWRR